MNELTAMRCERMEPLFPYVSRSIELERERIAAGVRYEGDSVVIALHQLDAVLVGLPQDYQKAINEVVRYETTLLLLACMPQAVSIRAIGHTTCRH